MLNLAEYRKKPQALADFLPWAALVGSGVVLNKDGSLQHSARFRGPDLDSATGSELVGASARLNSAIRRLGSGWTLFVEASRSPSNRYPNSIFSDPASELVDAERRSQFEAEGAHFERAYTLTLVWMPPADDAARAEGWLYENRADKGASARDHLDQFVDRTDRLLALVSGFVPEAGWLRQFAVDGRRKRMEDFGVLRAEYPERAGAAFAEMPLTGADAAPAMFVVEHRVKHGGLALNRQRSLVGMKIDRVAASARGLSANRAVTPHEWNGRVAVGGEANLAAAVRTFELDGRNEFLLRGNAWSSRLGSGSASTRPEKKAPDPVVRPRRASPSQADE